VPVGFPVVVALFVPVPVPGVAPADDAPAPVAGAVDEEPAFVVVAVSAEPAAGLEPAVPAGPDPELGLPLGFAAVLELGDGDAVGPGSCAREAAASRAGSIAQETPLSCTVVISRPSRPVDCIAPTSAEVGSEASPWATAEVTGTSTVIRVGCWDATGSQTMKVSATPTRSGREPRGAVHTSTAIPRGPNAVAVWVRPKTEAGTVSVTGSLRCGRSGAGRVCR
jgi:hypothetical protein